MTRTSFENATSTRDWVFRYTTEPSSSFSARCSPRTVAVAPRLRARGACQSAMASDESRRRGCGRCQSRSARTPARLRGRQGRRSRGSAARPVRERRCRSRARCCALPRRVFRCRGGGPHRRAQTLSTPPRRAGTPPRGVAKVSSHAAKRLSVAPSGSSSSRSQCAASSARVGGSGRSQDIYRFVNDPNGRTDTERPHG